VVEKIAGMPKAVFSWSTGKDSALALYKCVAERKLDVITLLTTLSEYDRVGFHGIRRALLEQQALSLGLPLTPVTIPTCQSVDEYQKHLLPSLKALCGQNATHAVYGDIFLEAMMDFRRGLLSETGLQGTFPLWGQESKRLLQEFLDLGFKAILTSVDSRVLPEEFLGRTLDQDLLDAFPKNVDPCGENGEYHTFVYDGPLFGFPVSFCTGETVLRNGFYYLDLMPNPLPGLPLTAVSTKNTACLDRMQHLNPYMQEQVWLLYQQCAAVGIHFEIASGKRDYQEQKSFFEQYGKTYDASKLGFPGTSRHEAGLAVDLIINGSISYTESYAEVGRLWEGMGFTWGQNTSYDEYWHFEIGYHAYLEALAKFRAGKRLPQPAL
jgi:uncharacterized protein (TIGR00290 family)